MIRLREMSREKVEGALSKAMNSMGGRRTLRRVQSNASSPRVNRLKALVSRTDPLRSAKEVGKDNPHLGLRAMAMSDIPNSSKTSRHFKLKSKLASMTDPDHETHRQAHRFAKYLTKNKESGASVRNNLLEMVTMKPLQVARGSEEGNLLNRRLRSFRDSAVDTRSDPRLRSLLRVARRGQALLSSSATPSRSGYLYPIKVSKKSINDEMKRMTKRNPHGYYPVQESYPKSGAALKRKALYGKSGTPRNPVMESNIYFAPPTKLQLAMDLAKATGVSDAISNSMQSQTRRSNAWKGTKKGLKYGVAATVAAPFVMGGIDSAANIASMGYKKWQEERLPTREMAATYGGIALKHAPKIIGGAMLAGGLHGLLKRPDRNKKEKK